MQLTLDRIDQPLFFFIQITLGFIHQHLNDINRLAGQMQIDLGLALGIIDFPKMNQSTSGQRDKKGAEIDGWIFDHENKTPAVLYHERRDSQAVLVSKGGRMRWFLGIILGWSLLAAPALAAHSEMSAQETYELGERYLKRGYYTKALEQFNRVRTYFRDDPYALKAEIAIADMHYQKDEWDAARIAYEDFVRAHPRYAEMDYVLYRLGMTNYKKAPLVADRDQAWTRSAVNTWSTFTLRFPQSTYAPEVAKYLKKSKDRLAHKELIIGRFYDQREAPLAVEGRMVGLLQRYPDSPYVAEALSLLGKAYAQTDRLDLATSALNRLEAEYAGSTREIKKLKRAIHKAEQKAAHGAP